MGRRRKKEEKIIRKTLPVFYLCPRCGKNTIKATIDRKAEQAVVTCSNCGLRQAFKAHSQMDEVDAYSHFIDNYYKKEEKVVG